MDKPNLVLTKSLYPFTFNVYDDKPQLDLKQVKQIHGSTILNCQEASETKEADGIICLCGKCNLAIKTADCLPIAVIGENGIGLVHAGWRGLALEILKSDKIAELKPKIFFIGPHIRKEAYEVGEDFFSNFPKYKPVIIDSKVHCSLLDIALDQIKTFFPNASVEESNICTFEDIRYNSYRRNKTIKRNWNILLKG